MVTLDGEPSLVLSLYLRTDQRQWRVEMIEVEGLTKYYGNLAAIKDVSFRVEEGEILGFLGPNAAGKTTTMRILTAFMPPSAGTARVAGFDVWEDSLEVRKRIGYMPEMVPLYPEMTVSSYLSFVASIRHVSDGRQRIEEIMKTCALTDFAGTLIGRLSKGYRQRVGLAQALVHDPQVLILDEPTIGLDPRQIREVRQLIKGLGGSHTVILSTHILPEASEVCSRLVIINEGEVAAEGTPEELGSKLEQARRVLVQVRDPSPDVVRLVGAIEGVTGVETSGDGQYVVACGAGLDPRAEISSLVVQQGWGLLELRPLGLTLEDIFLRLTTEEEVHKGEEAA
jgi:ABC-2 type transport system ATP-binding protein